MKKNNYLIIKLIFLITLFSCVKNENNITNKNNSTQISEVIINEPIDLSIKNILIYPNQFDKRSMYMDVEILSTNEGEGEVQIALLNDKKLIASNSIKIISNQQNYFQSFLINDKVDYEKNFEIGISALNGEVNVSNNKHIFKIADNNQN